MPTRDRVLATLRRLREGPARDAIDRAGLLREIEEAERLLRDEGAAAPTDTVIPTPLTGSEVHSVAGPGGECGLCGTLPPPAAPGCSDVLEPGKLFASRFHIEEKIGEGGMGRTYRASDLVLCQTVCIKVLRPEFCENKDMLARFVSEVRVGRRLQHENFVRIHDVDRCGNLIYMTMEYAQGTPMRRWLEGYRERRRPIPVAQVLAVQGQILEPLCEAHDKGIVHRDLKPENVILKGDPASKGFRVEVLDFGIAKMLEGPRITMDGTRMGTFSYMAPEQEFVAGEVGPPADVFSAGVMLYEMLVGSRPAGAFQAPAEARSGCPAWLSDAAMRALQPRPKDRFPSAKEFLRELAAHPGGSEASGSRRSAGPASKKTAAVAAAGRAAPSGKTKAGTRATRRPSTH
jgi:serine/threonine protein kinase